MRTALGFVCLLLAAGALAAVAQAAVARGTQYRVCHESPVSVLKATKRPNVTCGTAERVLEKAHEACRPTFVDAHGGACKSFTEGHRRWKCRVTGPDAAGVTTWRCNAFVHTHWRGRVIYTRRS